MHIFAEPVTYAVRKCNITARLENQLAKIEAPHK